MRTLNYYFCTLVVTILTGAGCATITNDPNQPVQFVASGCGDVEVKCSAQNKRGSWDFEPSDTVQIRRSDDNLNINCSMSNGLQHAQSIPSRLGGKIVASAIFLDFGIVDAITDKHREYPAQVLLTVCDNE